MLIVRQVAKGRYSGNQRHEGGRAASQTLGTRFSTRQKWMAAHAPEATTLSVVAVAMPRRYPCVDIQREATAMRADVRQGHASHTRHRDDDPPQEVGALSLEFLHNAQTADIFHGKLCHRPPEASQRSTHRAYFFFPILVEAFTIARLLCIVCAAHLLGIAICIRISFDLLQNFYEGRLLCHLTLYSCLPFLSAVR